MFFGFLGFYGPCYYIQPYAIQRGITDENLGFYLLPFLNTASIAGRIIPNFITDYIGPLNVLMPASLITGILALCWIGITTKGGVIAFAVLYGLFSGGFVSLPPVALVTLTPDLRTLGTRMGQSFGLASIALLIGSPIAGAILKQTGSYLGLQLYSGLSLFLCGMLLVAARVSKVGWSLKMKA
jgi:predicted MFS family arabinose efflux permease